MSEQQNSMGCNCAQAGGVSWMTTRRNLGSVTIVHQCESCMAHVDSESLTRNNNDLVLARPQSEKLDLV